MTTRANDIASLLSHNNGGIDSSSLPSNIVYGLSGLPSGTKALFVQSAAPTGWTKDTSHDNKALRVVSGTVGSGGNDGFTTTFGTGKSTAGHTLTTDQMPSHSHTIVSVTGSSAMLHSNSYQGGNPDHWSSSVRNEQSGSRGGNQAHSHDLSNFDLAYVDVIIATKN